MKTMRFDGQPEPAYGQQSTFYPQRTVNLGDENIRENGDENIREEFGDENIRENGDENISEEFGDDDDERRVRFDDQEKVDPFESMAPAGDGGPTDGDDFKGKKSSVFEEPVAEEPGDKDDNAIATDVFG